MASAILSKVITVELPSERSFGDFRTASAAVRIAWRIASGDSLARPVCGACDSQASKTPMTIIPSNPSPSGMLSFIERSS